MLYTYAIFTNVIIRSTNGLWGGGGYWSQKMGGWSVGKMLFLKTSPSVFQVI